MDTQFTPDEIEVPTKRRQGFWNKMGGPALTFAILIHLIILILGAIWIFSVVKLPEKKVDFMPGGGGGGGERGVETKVNNKKRAQLTPTTSVKRVTAEGATSSYAIPDPGDNFGEMSTLSAISGGGMSGGLGGSGSGKGFGSGSGGGMGDGHGSGKLFGLIPETMGKRCSKEDRLQRIKDNGGTPACEDAVVKALRYLKSRQNSNGSWGQQGQWCGPASMTGLVLLAYFGHCETPASQEFGDSALLGITYLVNLGMKNNGKLSTNLGDTHWCYEHAIATYALGEAATFCKDLKMQIPNLMEITEKAGQFIIDNQNANGGWAYSYAKAGGHTDTSIVGWQLQALKACSHNGTIKYKGLATSVRRGLKYMSACQNPNGGFGYSGITSNNPSYFTLTGVGVLCNQMWNRAGSSDVRKGLKYIMENTKFNYNTANSDLYQHYYESQAMMQCGGKEWAHYNNLFRDQILQNQMESGLWKVPGNKGHVFGDGHPNGDIYRTCLCTLMLEVYYRFLSTGGGGIRDRDI